MCGICGKINLNASAPIDEAFIANMAEILKHRGPDDRGIYLDNLNTQNGRISVGLGHRRLSIIDLSAAARQPMSNENNTIWIVYNGEIYNCQELRKNLEAKGHIFKSHSDTETIIHLYEDFGTQCLEYLRGMFSFAIWDKNKSELFLARDRVGKKPLYYALKNNSLVFASEMKAILKDREINKEIDFHSIHDYLTYQYIPAPASIFKEIKKLPPAHMLIWKNGNVTIKKYWDLDYAKKVRMSETEYSQRLYALFSESVKLRLISDVPLGAFLSGGIDSSAVVAMMSKLCTKPVKTFSIGFDDPSFNELEYARKISKLFNTEHHEYIVRPNALEVLPKLIWHFDEPFADYSAIPTYYLSKMTRQEVTVALNGDGGDESFAGYVRYAANRLAYYYYKIVPSLVREKVIKKMTKRFKASSERSLFDRINKFLDVTARSREERYIRWMSIFSNELKDAIYSDMFRQQLRNFDSHQYLLHLYMQSTQSNAKDFLDSTLFVDAMSYLPNDLLVKVDITSMANSLEVRCPFLDHKIMEFAASMPSDLKLKGFTKKYILKKMLCGILPKGTLLRKKRGFGIPIGSWFRNELKDYIGDVLLSPKSLNRGYFKKEGIKRLLDEHMSGNANHGHRLWALLILELWHQRFID